MYRWKSGCKVLPRATSRKHECCFPSCFSHNFGFFSFWGAVKGASYHFCAPYLIFSRLSGSNPYRSRVFFGGVCHQLRHNSAYIGSLMPTLKKNVSSKSALLESKCSAIKERKERDQSRNIRIKVSKTKSAAKSDSESSLQKELEVSDPPLSPLLENLDCGSLPTEKKGPHRTHRSTFKVLPTRIKKGNPSGCSDKTDFLSDPSCASLQATSSSSESDQRSRNSEEEVKQSLSCVPFSPSFTCDSSSQSCFPSELSVGKSTTNRIVPSDNSTVATCARKEKEEGAIPEVAAVLHEPSSFLTENVLQSSYIRSSSSTATSNLSSSPSSLITSPSASPHRLAYEELLDQTYINPFNGKRLHVESSTAKLLSSLGFIRREDNPLFVQWRPEIYMKTVENARKKIEEKMVRKYQQQLKRYEKKQKNSQQQEDDCKGRKHRSKEETTPRKKSEHVDENSSFSLPAPLSPPSIQQGVDMVLQPLERRRSFSRNGERKDGVQPSGQQSWMDALLSSSDTAVDGNVVLAMTAAFSSSNSSSSSSWMLELSALLRRPDALTTIPRFLEQRYFDLSTSSVMPPKLDTSATDFSMPLPLTAREEAPDLSTRSAPENGMKEKSGLLNTTSEVVVSNVKKDGKQEISEDANSQCTSTTLTVDQLNVLNLAQQGYSMFIGGSAGTGKTVLLRQIHKQLTQMGLRVAMTATTGVAAVQLGGCTFHHAFNAPIYASSGGGMDGLSTSSGVGLSAELWNRRWDQTVLRAVDVVIVDEVSLLDAQTFDAFDMEARLARMSSQPFGGIQVLICGDFLQLSIGLQDALPAFLSTAFEYLMKVRLETPMRHRLGDPLLPLLNKVRRGEFDAKLFSPLDKPIPQDTDDSEVGEKEKCWSTITFIFPRRRDAQKLNDAKLAQLITMEKLFAPQRGPLRLSGEFTSSAFIEMHSRASMPSRAKVLDVLRIELDLLLRAQLQEITCTKDSKADANECNEGEKQPKVTPVASSTSTSLFSLSGKGVSSGYIAALMTVLSSSTTTSTLLTELDVVVMPAQTTVSLSSASSCSTSSSFFLRIRYPQRHSGLSNLCSPTTTSSTGATTDSLHASLEPDPGELMRKDEQIERNAETEKRCDPTLAPTSNISTFTRRRAGLLQVLLTKDVWERLAHAVASRLSARVVTFFEDEPRSMIPLSVSMALADMTNNDIAQTLLPLRLKLGCRVMVNRNLSRRVSNGSVGTVEAFAAPDPSLFPTRCSGYTDFSRYSATAAAAKVIEAECFDQLPIVRLMDGSVVQIPPIPIHIGGTPMTYYYGHDVYAIPIQLGYAFTVHKVQGLTLQGTVVLDCKNFFDCPHLVYVACSRVTSIDQLIVKNIKPGMVMVKQSALEFSDTLTPASDAADLIPPPEVARGSWAMHALSSAADGLMSASVL